MASLLFLLLVVRAVVVIGGECWGFEAERVGWERFGEEGGGGRAEEEELGCGFHCEFPIERYKYMLLKS